MINDLAFNLAFIKLMDLEGGYSNDPQDPGGKTKHGISARYNPDVDIENLTLDDAAKIYRHKYWDAAKLNMIENPELARKIFIFGVNAGMKRAVRHLQQAANALGANLEADGIIGPKTAGWVNSYRHQIALIAAFKTYCNKWYLDHSVPRFIAGWLKRLEA